MRQRDDARLEGFESWWATRRKKVVPSMRGVAETIAKQAFLAGYDYRDCNGPDEKIARQCPHPQDRWVKRHSNGRRCERVICKINRSEVTFDEKVGFENWTTKTVLRGSFGEWSKTARLDQRGAAARSA